jgi:hypothetical protein
VQHARGGVATGVVAVLRKAAVALLPRLDEAVPADWTVEERRRFVLQTVVHPVSERQQQIVQTATGPMLGGHRRAAGSHYAALVRARTLVSVVLHAEIVAHFVRHRRGDQSHDDRVVGVDAPRILVSTDWPLESLSHDAVLETEFAARIQLGVASAERVTRLRQQLGVVVGVFLD